MLPITSNSPMKLRNFSKILICKSKLIFTKLAQYCLDCFSCLSILYSDDYQFNDDYKILLKTIPFELSENAVSQMQTSSNEPMEIENGQSMNMSQASSQYRRYPRYVARTSYPLHTQQLSFYCLSPSVAFAKDLKLARS